VHYNGAHPAIAKATEFFADARWSDSPGGNRSRRATKRPIAGIIDCAFENSENGLALDPALPAGLIGVASAQKPSIRILGKIFPQKTFPPSSFDMSGGFQDE
jgi:hypothetical protein